MDRRNRVILGMSMILSVGIAAVAGLACKEISKDIGDVVAVLSDEELEFVNNQPVESFYTPTDEYYSSRQYISMNHVGNIESVWDSYKGRGTKIAVIDTGININHEDFIRADGTSAISDDSKYYYISSNTVTVQTVKKHGWNCILHDYDSSKSAWSSTHGTNVAGTAAAATGNTNGTIGIAPEADIVVYKTDMNLASIKAAISDAASLGVDVINMSLGAYATSFTDYKGIAHTGSSSTASYLTYTINQAVSKGVIVIAAAGNEGTSYKSYPASNNNVIGVGALTQNSSSTAAAFSNFNDSSDVETDNHNVDIVAPGYVYAPSISGSQSSPAVDAYTQTQGTSFSSPIVAGAAALWKQKNPGGTPEEFAQDLYATAVDIGTDGYDYKFGHGRLDINNLIFNNVTDSIRLSTAEATVPTGTDYTIGVEYHSGDITWSSDDNTIATVDQNGKVTGIKAGSTYVRAKVGTAEGAVLIKVTEYIKATSITLNPTSYTIPVAGVYQINAKVEPSNATEQMLLFESEDKTIATVDDNGKVTGIKAGSTTIDIMGADDTWAEFDITVENPSDLVYKKVTESQSDWSGDYLFVYESTSVAFDGSLSALDVSGNTISVTITDGTIASTDTIDASKFTISPSSTSGKYYVKSASGKYIYGSSGSNVLNSADNASSSCDNTITWENNKPKIQANTCLCFNNTNAQNRFRYMKTDAANIAMYRLESGEMPIPEKTLQSISATYNGGDVCTGGIIGPEDFTVTAHYTAPDYYPDETVDDFEISGFDSATAGTKTVTITYGGKTTTCSVTVIEDPTAVLESIEIEGLAETFVYKSTASLTGLKVTAHYDKKADKDITSSVTLPSSINTSVLGPQSFEVSYTEGEVTKKTTGSYFVTNQSAAPVITVGKSTWDRVSSASELAIGDRIAIVASSQAYGMSNQEANNRNYVSVTKSNSNKNINQPSTLAVITLTAGTKTGTYGLLTDDGYLSAMSSSSNYLRSVEEITDNASWTISISSYNATITAQGSYTRKIIKFNYDTTNKKALCFSAYASGQQAVSIYKQNITESTSSWSGTDQAKAYATYFLSATSAACAATSLEGLNEVWSTLSAEYGYMIADSKTAFADSTDETIVAARERYLLIVKNYSSLEKFAIDGSVNTMRARSTTTMDNIDSSFAGIALISLIGVASVSLFGFFAKKKHQ